MFDASALQTHSILANVIPSTDQDNNKLVTKSASNLGEINKCVNNLGAINKCYKMKTNELNNYTETINSINGNSDSVDLMSNKINDNKELFTNDNHGNSSDESCSFLSSENYKNETNRSKLTRRRLTDDEGYIRRAACICVNDSETQVILVSSKKDADVWHVPGGGLEVGEEANDAAHREAWEEAGLHGNIARYLGLFESWHHSGSKKHRTSVYVFKVTEEHLEFPEASLGRRREWFSIDEAIILLSQHRPLQCAYLQLMIMTRLTSPSTTTPLKSPSTSPAT